MKYIILIPTYNPDDKLLQVLKTINKKYETIVVNDGSENKDMLKGCEEYAQIISYDENQGKGFALKTGFAYIKAHYKDYVVVTMDDDMQHKLEDAINLCDYVNDHEDEFAIGRRHWDKTTPITSRIGNAIARHTFKRHTGLSIYDTQTGLRAFSYKLIDYMLSIEGNRYEYEMNVLYNLKNNNIKYKEIDIQTIYIDNNKTSRFRVFKDSIKILKDMRKWKKKNK